MRIKEKRMKSFVSRANVLTQAKKQAEAAKAVSDGLQLSLIHIYMQRDREIIKSFERR